MKGIFWNSRGLSDLAKSKFLADTVRQKSLDFIALMETRKYDFSQAVLNGLCGDRNFIWHWTQPHGRSAGILLGINYDMLDIGSNEEGDFFCEIKTEK